LPVLSHGVGALTRVPEVARGGHGGCRHHGSDRSPAPRASGERVLIAYRLDRSFAWNASHTPKLPPRPRKLADGPTVTLFGHRLESPIGIAAGPLPSSKWIEAYARLGYGLLTYKTVRTAPHPAFPHPNLVFCRAGEPAVTQPHPGRKLDPASATWAVSLGLPSAEPDVWRADVQRARAKMRPSQVLIVSVAGTPAPGGDGEQLADDYGLCARMAAEAGADVVEVHLSCPNVTGQQPHMVFENVGLSTLVVQRVRRAVGTLPILAKLGAFASPRALHELATRLAPAVNGFVLVNGLQRRVMKPDGSPAFAGPGREVAGVVGGLVYDHCHIQVEELIAWRKAGAWDRVILAVGGITTVDRARHALAAGADGALVATAALIDPLIAARFRMSR
jgi:dihydroorotate dehydrogenase (NAD+) catalytic subunit